MNPEERPLLFAQIGDLHLTEAGAQNFKDFCAIAAQIETQCPDLDFVYLPGDNADHGRPEEYKLVATALKMLSCPVYLITGDHDMEQGSLNNFYSGTSAQPLPYEIRSRDYSCFFLDCCGNGAGGSDFRLGITQLQWLETGLQVATISGLKKLVFMHVYPQDLTDEEERAMIISLFDKYTVSLVSMGHTHYNELANDGVTVFSATRSTGQIEEGPVGYSLTAVDGENVSWRFKALADPFPFVLITSPGDFRLKRTTTTNTEGNRLVRAVVFGGYRLLDVSYRLNAGEWKAMRFNDELACWEAIELLTEQGEVNIIVRAIDERNRPGFHEVTWNDALPAKTQRAKQGSDEDRILFWPENGIPGTQLGPNRNAKPFPKPLRP